jgi:hypothetical protein
MAIRDRLPIEALGRWNGEPGVDEVVLVDFGSRPALPAGALAGLDRVVLVRVGGREPWSRGLALNVGIAASASDTIIAVDPGDHLRDAARQARALAKSGSYLTSYGADKGTASDIVLLRRSEWEQVGGFHEYLLGWGFEDEDLFNRLEDAGSTHRFLEPDAFAGGQPSRFDETAPSDIVLPNGLERQRWFQNNRNKILAGLVPWTAALPALRPRRFGRPGARIVTCDLAPRSTLEKRLFDGATYLAARFLHDAPDSVAYPMLRAMVDERYGSYQERAGRQHQIDRALALAGRMASTE